MGPTTSNYTTLVASLSLEKMSLPGLVTQPSANNIIEIFKSSNGMIFLWRIQMCNGCNTTFNGLEIFSSRVFNDLIFFTSVCISKVKSSLALLFI